MLIFVLLILLIVGGNCLLIWQFRIARLQTDRLIAVSHQLIAVLRLEESLLSFHQRMDELTRSRDAQRLIAEAQPLRQTLLEQTAQTRKSLSHLPSAAHVDPALLATLEAIEITLPRQLDAVTDLALSGDWDAVQLRLGDELKPFENQTSALVNNIDEEVNEELTDAVTKMFNVQRRIFLIVPVTAISTFLIATVFGWTMTRRTVELRMEERVSERTRITRELHDTFLQTVQGSKLFADNALSECSDFAEMRQAMEKLSYWLGQATQEGRAALNSLRVSTTEKNDLAEALRRAIEECRTQTCIEASFSVAGTPREMHPIVRDEVYRIGYEAVRNACKHSEGDRLEVGLRYAHDLTVYISDNGKGMDRAIAARGKDGHFGLQGMRERALRIGGKLSLATSADSGTRVELIVPGRNIFRDARPAWFSRVKALFDRTDRTSNGLT
jgi:signal transduction histidine kinase